MPKTAGIILVGNEILSGKIADANAAYLCRELRALGVDVRRVAVIPDEVEVIAREVAAFSRDHDVVGETVRFPTILMRNVYILPGVPEIFRQKFEAIRERFRDQPIHLSNVFVAIGEGSLADYLNGLLADFPLLLLGSYPEFSNPEYKVKVTLESRDRGYLEGALAEFLRRLPADALVRVT